jgi:hypothetical protein
MPNLLRLHDSGTEWSEINQASSGTTQWVWTDLDLYLDAIAAHPGTTVMETFTAIPCWAAGISQQNCTFSRVYTHGTNVIPTDLANNPSGGSPFFNAFVTAFVQHCSTNMNCVGPCPVHQTCNSTDLILYFDMWNEWDISDHWLKGAPPTGCGTSASACAQLLYDMIAPAVSIIHQYIPTAVILMPSATMGSPLTYQCDLAAWLNTENTNNGGTHISKVVNWHAYLTAGSGANTNTPEYQWANFGANFLAVQNSTSYSTNCGLPNGTSYDTHGWSSAPWVDSETNFIGNAGNYACPVTTTVPPPTGHYSETDCAGQIARWQLLHDSNSASGLFWYYGNTTIGNGPTTPVSYATVYTNLQDYLIGGTRNGSCSSSGTAPQVWTCNYTQGSTPVQFVWACTLGSNGYCTATTSTFPHSTTGTGFTSYRNLSSSDQTWHTISGNSVTIGAVPVELE